MSMTARTIAESCAPLCTNSAAHGPLRGTRNAEWPRVEYKGLCPDCNGTGKLGVDAITAALEADRAELDKVHSRAIEEIRTLHAVLDKQRDAEVSALRAQLDDAVALLPRRAKP